MPAVMNVGRAPVPGLEQTVQAVTLLVGLLSYKKQHVKITHVVTGFIL